MLPSWTPSVGGGGGGAVCRDKRGSSVVGQRLPELLGHTTLWKPRVLVMGFSAGGLSSKSKTETDLPIIV